MKKLNDLICAINFAEVFGSANPKIIQIVFDSRLVKPDSLFVAVKGSQIDGHKFIEPAIQSGAVAIVCEELPDNLSDHSVYIKVRNTRQALAILAAEFFDHPSKKIKLVGITGTNGKTTTTSILFNLFKNLGYKSGLLSTIENRIHNEIIKSTHTTPDIIQINELLDRMSKKKVEYCFMEVSSHAIQQERIFGLKFAGGVFTNITHEHLDYHKNFKSYLKTKKKFFDDLPKTAFALANLDDKNGSVILQNTKAAKYTYGLSGTNDYNCKIIESHFDGLQLQIENKPVWFHLVGKFNAYNLLAAFATATLLGVDKFEILTQLSKIKPVKGRFELLRSKEGISVVIDYAHTPDALKSILETLINLRTGNEQLITVIGAGGNRDKTKRPLLAKIACKLSNKVILTSDNPRNEDPEEIIKDMKTGIEISDVQKILSITNRIEAIKTAVSIAQKGDIVLLAGKGHENYQIIKGQILSLDEKKIVHEVLKII